MENNTGKTMNSSIYPATAFDEKAKPIECQSSVPSPEMENPFIEEDFVEMIEYGCYSHIPNRLREKYKDDISVVKGGYWEDEGNDRYKYTRTDILKIKDTYWQVELIAYGDIENGLEPTSSDGRVSEAFEVEPRLVTKTAYVPKGFRTP